MRVLHVTVSLPGGISTYMRELLVDQCARWGAGQVHILIPESHGEHLVRAQGLQAHSFRSAGGRLIELVLLSLAAWRAIRSLQPDIVHAHSTAAGIAVRLCRLLMPRGPAVAYCAHGWAFLRDVAPWQNRALAFVERLLAPASDAISSISFTEHEAALRAGLPADRCRAIRNGLSEAAPDTPPAFKVDPARLNFLFLGRHDRQKGLDLALDVFRRLPADRYRLYVAGQRILGDARPSDATSADNVCHIGWIAPDRIDACIRSFDALIVPSRWEGFGLVVLEAMRNSVAVLASNRGALPELVADGVSGCVFDPERPDQIEALLRSLDRPALKRMGAAGLRRFRAEFGARRMCEETVAMYDDALERRRETASR